MASEGEVRAAMSRLRASALVQPRAWRDEETRAAAWREYLRALLPVSAAALNAAVSRTIDTARHFPMISELLAAVADEAPRERSDAELMWLRLLADYRPGDRWPWSSVWGCCRPEQGCPQGCPPAVYETWRARHMRPALRVIEGGAG